jgi:hypothetical protein
MEKKNYLFLIYFLEDSQMNGLQYQKSVDITGTYDDLIHSKMY